jgi:hypothetical protein
MQTPDSTRIRFHVQRSSLWQPAEAGAKAEIPELPALLRRRAGEADRAALRVAFDCCGPVSKVPALFCSRHGEVQRSVELLEQLAKDEPLSPMAFSLSVHNAAAALYSITQGNTAPMSAVAAGRDSLPMTLLEAAALLAAGEPSVLVVAYDGALPDTFKPYKDEDDSPYGLGLLLNRTEGPAFSLELAPGDEAAGPVPHALQLADWLAGGARSLSIPSSPRRWTWRRDD